MGCMCRLDTKLHHEIINKYNTITLYANIYSGHNKRIFCAFICKAVGITNLTLDPNKEIKIAILRVQCVIVDLVLTS